MYHLSNQQLIYHHTHNTYEQCPIFIDHPKHVVPTSAQNNIFESEFSQNVNTQSEIVHSQQEVQTHTKQSEKTKKIVTNKTSVDTSNFSIEERLVAAVWVHERKRTRSSMCQIKHDFRERFGREPPAKNTLLVWERKLFSTGSVCDAPRPGRPVNRKSHVDEVVASVRSAPALSLCARALALRVPRTTLRTILHKDLSHAVSKVKDVGHKTTGRKERKRKVKQVMKKLQPPIAHKPGICAPPAIASTQGPHYVQPMHNILTHTTYT